MGENLKMAQLGRVQDLDPKLIACDPLPDVDRETDLNYFITQWRETKDTDLKEAITSSQIAENVVRSMQVKKGEALAEYNTPLLDWCRDYTDRLRKIELRKFDEITAHVFEYMDVHTRMTAEEIQQQNENKRGGNRAGDSNRKHTLVMVEHTDDLLFGIWANVQGKHRLHYDIEFGNYTAQLPVKQSNVHVVLRCLWTSYDYLTENQIQDDYVVGGVVDFQLYSFPEYCKVIQKAWTIRTILTVEQRLKNISFPEPTAINTNEMEVDLKFSLPDTIYMSEEQDQITIAVWDVERQGWFTEYIVANKIMYNKEKRQITFPTKKFAPMAMLQSRVTDFPYQKWKLRCVEDAKALLDLETKRLVLQFEITPLQLRLINCEEPALAHLNEKERLSPGYLLQELAKCGILLMPRDEDAQLAGIDLKDRAAEERAIADVSLGVRAFHFRSCKWNMTRDPENPGVKKETILMKIRENLEFDSEFEEDYEPDWRYVMWWNNKCSFVEGCKESQETNCDPQITQGHVTHGLLSQACEPPMCSEAAYTRAQDLSFIEFSETLKRTLRLLRLFSFS